MPITQRFSARAVLRSLGLLAMLGSSGCAPGAGVESVRGAALPGFAGDDVELDTFVQKIPKTSLSLELVRVPMPGEREPLWFASHEVSWDAYDVFVFALDEQDGETDADAIVRPSKPYVLADYGFGRAGFPVISVSPQGAQAFCTWLSLRTGRRYRLPTEVEWEAAASAAGFDAAGTVLREAGQKFAWLADNAQRRTHRLGRRRTDAAGLHDLFGNAAEWCLDAEGAPVLKGGSFQTMAAEVSPAWRAVPTPAWKQRDPQIPKSPWWLSDAPFAGFRVVCEDVAAAPDGPADALPAAAPADTDTDAPDSADHSPTEDDR